MKLSFSKNLTVSLIAVVFLANCGTGDSTSDGATSKSADTQRSGLKRPSSNGAVNLDYDLSQKERLGKLLFFDKDLSEPAGMACATCHDPKVAFVDPNKELPVSQGIHHTRFGNRNAPTAAYALYTPEFHLGKDSKGNPLYKGGQFLDGRVNTLADQAKGPFLNPLEMAVADGSIVASKVQNASYVNLFKRVYGDDAFDDLNQTYEYIADAIAEFENTDLFNPFNSDYDWYKYGDETALTEQELNGMALFNGKAKCNKCHFSTDLEDGTPTLFTNHGYFNIGVPANPTLPFYDLNTTFNPAGHQFIDLGLGGVLNDTAENGKFRVPTLRNVALTAPYMHNGVFNTLREVVVFYNTRDTRANWPAPEVSENMDTIKMGNLGLTEQEVDDVVAFLKALTDYTYMEME